MPICPKGHQSTTDDWCEFCGTRMAPSAYGPRPTSSASSSSASPASAPPSSASPPGFDGGRTAVAEVCPECGTPREGAALFCEECRYNFQTHSATIAPVSPPAPAPQNYPPYQRYESQRSRPSQINRPAEPVPSESVTVTSGSGDFLLDPPSTPVHPGPGAGRGGPAAAGPPFAAAGNSAPPAPSVTAANAAPATASAALSSPPVTSPNAPDSPGSPAAANSGHPAHSANPVHSANEATSAVGPQAVPTVVPTAPGPGTAWVAVIHADREYFTATMARSGPEAQGLYFPAFSPEVQLPLIGNQITIGRRRQSTGVAPDIDLSRAPEDPGVSHQHAVLVQQPDGTWAVVDQDSTNGTTVNLSEDPIRPYTPVPLDEGDRVHVGAWTTITIRRA